ncbi:MAG: flagellar hook-associated protein FlgL [Proteobacteria bacterium]|jgi:flagellar hook-associated protein 3 FlgL|nr:flagellar hook-associated protein FlgL [Pseudomonadota bacterium]
MTRVSENSTLHSINYATGKTKSKVEDLQIKGSNMKRIQKPSDDPIGNVDLLQIRSQNIDANQYLRNLNFAQTSLGFTETVLEELTDILSKAKELAIGQSSDIYNPEVRQSVSKEIHQLRMQALSLANKRMGNRYLFSGQKLLTRPFDTEGKYNGDKNKIFIEINKDVFIPINITGNELFFDSESKPSSRLSLPDKAEDIPTEVSADQGRNLASQPGEGISTSIFDELGSLENALLTNNPDVIQSLLEQMDRSIDRVVAYRAKIGALSNNITNAENNIEKQKLLNEEYKTKVEDADVAELFSNLQKEQGILKATYQASGVLMNTKLMDFLR